MKTKEELKQEIIEALKTVYDPEIAINVYDLGLIYGVDIDDDNNIVVTMTLTTPNCPVAETFPIEIETRVREVEGTKDVIVEVVFEPPWTQDLMSDDAKLELGFILDL
ncbi:MAG: SUF system Fe-S cluster assembly protein [Candidatus Peregrinibacteria bacterium]|nr:SUF system Fe-S cluster assembly protein [Candidatus Peregrinibacteria bacterium]MDZ4244971.1 SUF system Fe-S cluster assembly protein [Candidatus Gracilibacteria bacterium]